ncbi:MAG: hypothetical protein ACLUEF_02445 [Faecalibacterium prausnitzii]
MIIRRFIFPWTASGVKWFPAIFVLKEAEAARWLTKEEFDSVPVENSADQDHFGCYQKLNAASETTPYQRI